MRYDFWVCGNLKGPDEINPKIALQDPLAQEIVGILAQAPATEAQLVAGLDSTEKEVTIVLNALVRTGALAIDEGAYRLAFCLLTLADKPRVWDMATEIGAEVAGRLRDRGEELRDAVAPVSSSSYVAAEHLLFALVGCFGLDWGGLRRLTELGYLNTNKIQPGGGDYELFGAERADQERRRLCSSHSTTINGYCFTSFGDWSARRQSFPDLLWELREAVEGCISLARKVAFGLAVQSYHRDMLEDTAHTLEALARTAGTAAESTQVAQPSSEKVSVLSSLLVELGYLDEQHEPLVPVFVASDRAAIATVVGAVEAEVESIMVDRHDEIRRSMAGTTPELHGVPFAETLTELWHYIFAEANRLLIEDGLMAIPARPGHSSSRYMPWLTCPGGDPRFPLP